MNAATYLPDTPSELLTVALDDLKKVERSTRYIVDMEFWHLPTKYAIGKYGYNNKCVVCLAGAALAKTLKNDPGMWIDPGNPDTVSPVQIGDNPSDAQKVYALDLFREGEVRQAMERLGYSEFDDLNTRSITPYDENPAQFKRDLRKLARDLMNLGY